MRISLTPETAQRIRDALGSDVDLAPEGTPTVLARLAVEAPTIYSEVLSQISGSQIRLDSENELQKRQRRGMLRRLFFSWGEYETAVGDRLLAKRHIAAAVPLSLAAVTLVFFAVALIFGHRPTSSSARHVAASEEMSRGAALPGRQSPMVVAPRPYAFPQEDPVGGLVSVPGGPTAHASLAGPLPVPALSGPGESPAFVMRSPGSPIVVTTQNPPDPGVSARPGGAVPVVYNRAPDSGVEGPPSPQDPRGESTAAKPLLVPGTRLPGRLVTGVLVVPGGPPMPAVVETTDPPGIWLGQAVLGPGGRVQVTLSLVGQDRNASIRGVALDADRLVPGLVGRTSVQHPAAGAAVATAALAATADYVQAVARQGSISAVDGWLQFSGGPPAPAWTYMAARLAQDLDTRGLSGTWTSTTEIPAGAQLVILVMGAS